MFRHLAALPIFQRKIHLYQFGKLSRLRHIRSYKQRISLVINNKFPGDIETETQKWYAGLRFYGNNPEHSLNADMCNFLADLQENRESLESYFTGKDMFDMWKKQTLEYYTSKPVTHKEIEELDFETRIRKRDELLTQKFSNNEQK